MEVFSKPWFIAVLQAAEAPYAITVLKFSRGFASFWGLVSNGQPKKCVRKADQSYPANGVILIGDQCYPMQRSILPLKKKIKAKVWVIAKTWVKTFISFFPRRQLNYMFKVNNRNSRTRFEICSKFTIKTPWRHSGVFILLNLLILDV